MYLLKIEQAAQAAQVPTLVGKSYTVGNVTSSGTGLSKWLALHPTAAGAAGKGTVMLKVEGGRQLPALIGKTVTVGKSPVLGAAGTKYLALHPAGAMAAKGAAGVGAAGAAGKGTMVMKVNGANGHLQAMTGKAFVVGKAPIVGSGAAANNMLVLHPLDPATVAQGASVAAKGSAGTIFAAGKGVAAKAAAGNAAVGAATVAKGGAAAGGTIWSGTGLSLGLGLGLGAFGPLMLATAVGAGGYYLYCRSRNKENDADLDADDGFAADTASATS